MANKIEKTFFDTLGIKPEIFTGCKLEKNNWKENTCPFGQDGIMELCHKDCKYAFTKQEIYPQITDHILLELICIYNQYLHPLTIYSTKKEFLKNDILERTINIINYFYEHEMEEYSKFKQQVRTLFEEAEL